MVSPVGKMQGQLVPERSMNACSEPSGLSLPAEPHGGRRHDQEPSDGIAGSQQPDNDNHHSRRVEETQGEHDGRIA